MKKTIVCIFAHPDDEAFGPGGTIAILAKDNDVFIICVTDGDAGQATVVEKEKLGEVRKEELRKSAGILGIQDVFFLGYHDGMLCNNIYHEVAEKIEKILRKLQPEMLLTFEPRGISGHIDHIFVSMVTTFLFERLPFAKTVWFFCNSDILRRKVPDYFIYFPPGYKKTEVNKVIDTSDVWDIKVKAMHEHVSQSEDMEKVLGWQKQVPREEYFLILQK